MNRIRMFKHFGVKPYVVFDGDFLPSKARTEASRAARREESRRHGLELLKAGKSSAAHLELQKAIDITPEMARLLIEELKKADIQYVVAPYEADAQLVYLERQGLIHGIVSEDSDLLVFGARRLLTKLDQYGKCIEINRRDFCRCREVSFTGWTDDDFRHMAILSGCDYLQGIGNMGLKTAHRMLRKYKTVDRLVRMLKFDGKFKFPENYMTEFNQADLTFQYQRVFCPIKQLVVLLTEPKTNIDIETMPFIGAPIMPELACAVACGDVNPITKEPITLETLQRPSTSSSPFPKLHISMPASLPQGKSINSYFQPDRIPLGAMHRNVFRRVSPAASPLTENRAPSPALSLPRPYLPEAYKIPYRVSSSRRHSEPVSNTIHQTQTRDDSQSLGQTPVRTAGAIPSSAISLSRFSSSSRSSGRPRKKARLCHDQTAVTPSNGKRSKFFSGAASQSKIKSRHTGDFPISRNQIKDALACLPDLDGWDNVDESGVSSICVYDDSASKKPRSRSSSPKQCLSQASVLEKVETPSRRYISQFLYSDSTADARCTIIPRTDSDRLMADRRSFSALHYSETQTTPHLDSAATTPITSPLSSISPSKNHQASIRSPLAARVPRSSLEHETPAAHCININRNKRQRSSLGPLIDVNPALIPLPLVDTAEVFALNTNDDENFPVKTTAGAKISAMGSEDLLASENDLSEESAGLNLRSRFNLSRFMHSS